MLSATQGLDAYDTHRRYFARVKNAAPLNRLLYVDLRITIGDNDLFKVTRMAELAGIAVRFPRMNRWRRDKKAADADTLESLRMLSRT